MHVFERAQLPIQRDMVYLWLYIYIIYIYTSGLQLIYLHCCPQAPRMMRATMLCVLSWLMIFWSIFFQVNLCCKPVLFCVQILSVSFSAGVPLAGQPLGANLHTEAQSAKQVALNASRICRVRRSRFLAGWCVIHECMHACALQFHVDHAPKRMWSMVVPFLRKAR